ncbi:hypothetical protein [Sagittula sp. S175]|uniref:hypothetical protein n=1 Tax=Sagittula sp. S175 TaxID=3415129 RepID=UPI003C7E37CE
MKAESRLETGYEPAGYSPVQRDFTQGDSAIANHLARLTRIAFECLRQKGRNSTIDAAEAIEMK